jgi:hypothetical protein
MPSAVSTSNYYVGQSLQATQAQLATDGPKITGAGQLISSQTWQGANTFTGQVIIAPAAAGTALVVNAFSGNYVANFTSPNSAGNSFGPIITAGTNSTDTALYVRNAAASEIYLVINGDGSGQLGGTALQWRTTPSIGFLGASPAAQITGWGTPTGASIQNNFAGGAATLATLGAAVAKIITDLKTFGLYGA